MRRLHVVVVVIAGASRYIELYKGFKEGGERGLYGGGLGLLYMWWGRGEI